MPGPINRASIKPSADSRLRLSRVPRHNSQCKRIAGGYDDETPHRNAIKVTFVDCSSSTPSSRCHSRVMRDVSARQRQGYPILEGQPTLPLSTRAFGTLPISECFRRPRRRSFTLRAGRGGWPTAFLLRRAMQTPSPLFVNISHDYYLCPIRSIRRAYARLHAISTFHSPVPPDSPLALRVWTPCFPSLSRRNGNPRR